MINTSTSNSITIILGDQLYHSHPAFDLDCDYVMIESMDFNSQYKYHKGRLLHCLVAMREYKDYLISIDKSVRYIGLEEEKTLEDMFKMMVKMGYKTINISFVEDKEFGRLLSQLSEQYELSLNILPDNKFLTPKNAWLDYRSQYPKRLFMNDFYIFNRKRLAIDVDEKGNSIYTQWSLDEENRKKIPKTLEVPSSIKVYESVHTSKVKELIEIYFKDNYGSVSELYYPVNHIQALEHLDDFIKNKYELFGPYEDAMSNKDPFLFHSTLSPLLNNGLLTTDVVIAKLDQAVNIPNNSREGLIRQIIGWREWVRCLYWYVYEEDLTKYNFFQHHKPLPNYFWDKQYLEVIKDNTPLYNALNNVFEYGYCHHIERLMVISNWMVLNEYDPMECYSWFMTMFIDSYNWVMVANVMGMGLFADGGIFATKPYIAGGNYLKKMSDYADHKIWEHLWTDKFWALLFKHQEFFSTNPRLAMLIKSKKMK
jgi:deoxyribodipyrimidine photolyase-related protein